MTSDVDVIRRMNATRSPYTRSPGYSAFKLGAATDNLLSMLDEEKHMTRRNKLTPGVSYSLMLLKMEELNVSQYSGKGNPNLEQQIDSRIQDLVNLIDRKYKSQGANLVPFDFAQAAQYFTLDTLGDIAFGRPFGFLQADSDLHSYISTTKKSLPAIMLFSVFPWLNQLLEKPLVRNMIARKHTERHNPQS